MGLTTQSPFKTPMFFLALQYLLHGIFFTKIDQLAYENVCVEIYTLNLQHVPMNNFSINL